MAGFGFEPVMAMPWTDAKAFMACIGQAKKQELLNMAIAGRMAQTTERDWKKAVRELT